MLNSKIPSVGVLLPILLTCLLSLPANATVYSWKDKNGDIHYSQFPRKMVEKNVAQSRATRKQAERKAAKTQPVQEEAQLLDGLDDIMATASQLREPEKIITRSELKVKSKIPEPVVLFNEKSLTETVSVIKAQPKAEPVIVIKKRRKRADNNPFLAGINQKLKRENNKKVKARAKNDFLAGVNKKRNRNAKEPANIEVLDEKTALYLQDINKMLAGNDATTSSN